MAKINFKILCMLSLTITAVLLVNMASALVIESANVDTIAPGKAGSMDITLKNNLNNDVEDVSFSLNFANLPYFSSEGSSEYSYDEIREDSSKEFSFVIRTSANAKSGDYNIPYTITYKDGSTAKTQTGTIGIKVGANPELSYTITGENSVVGSRGKIIFKIVNKGLGDARFVSVRVSQANGYALLSDREVYIGTINSDDFDTATFTVLYEKEKATFDAVVEYTNFDNSKPISVITLPITVYSRARAEELGIIKPNLTWVYALAAAVIIVSVMIYRNIKKRRRLAKSLEMQKKMQIAAANTNNKNNPKGR